jgi:hypothetical protein
MPHYSIVADRRALSRYVSIYLHLLWRRRKIGGLNVPLASRIPNFSPVRAAYLSLWKVADPIFLGSGQRVRRVYLEETKGWCITAFKGTRRFIFKT